MNFTGNYGDALAFLIVWAAKATVLLSLAGIANLLLRRRAAALRHQVWAIAIVASLALPLVTLAVPTWHVLRAPVAAPPAPATIVTTITLSDTIVTVPARRDYTEMIVDGALLLWAIGAAIFFLRLLAGLARLTRTAAYARIVTEHSLTAILAELRKWFGVRRDIQVMESAGTTTMPMTWGMIRPRIVLPSGAAMWSAQRKRIVLSHEMAHVSRCDWAFQICAESLRGCFWFHPLAWISAKWMRQESEQACDDAVLHSGVAANEYASELLTLTQMLKTPGRRFSLALAISRPTNLETRFAAMLNSSTSREPLSRKTRVLAVVSAVLLLLPLAALTLSAAPSRELTPVAALPLAIEPSAAPSIEALPEATPSAARFGRRSHGGAIQGGAIGPDEAAKASAGSGRATFLKDCVGCHSAQAATSVSLDANGWTAELNKMVHYGASIPNADFPVLIDYLTTNSGSRGVSAISSEAISGRTNSTAPARPAGGQATATPTAAQTAPASISGVVVDPAGAVILGASVELTYESNPAIGSGSTTSGQDGDFTFPALVPGSYQLMINAQGFKRYLQKDIQLATGEHLNFHNISLQVGAITQEVTVTASASAPVAGNQSEEAPQSVCAASPVQAGPPPPPPVPGRVRIGGAVEQASIVCQNMPIYPAIAKRAHVQGTVVLHAIIGKDGSVKSLEFVSGPSLLINAAMDAVKQWRYKPLVLDGQPTEVESEISAVFTLNP